LKGENQILKREREVMMENLRLMRDVEKVELMLLRYGVP
jgi:hypothetical protein